MGVVLQFFVFTKKYLPHLKQILCHLYPPAIFSSAAKTDLAHFGHCGACGALKGIISSFLRSRKSNRTGYEFENDSPKYLAYLVELRYEHANNQGQR